MIEEQSKIIAVEKKDAEESLAGVARFGSCT